MDFDFTIFPVLETERLTLRALNLEDAKAIFGLRANKEVNEFIDRRSPKNLSEARAFIDLISNLAANNKGIFWVILKMKKIMQKLAMKYIQTTKKEAI